MAKLAQRKVFISHVSSETELAQVLKRHLIHDFRDLDVFVSSDGKSIQAGDNWFEELRKALKNAKVEIVLCSLESIGRPWVNFEAGAGWILRIRVIPVCHSGMRPNELPLPLNLLQTIEASQPNGLQRLYDSIAEVLGVPAPAAAFDAMAAEISELEEKYKQAKQDLERIEHPLILCASSEQYSGMDFDLDVAVLEETFPRQVVVERKLTSQRLSELLGRQRFDIVHLAIAVDTKSGELQFTPSNADPQDLDTMSAGRFAERLRDSPTRLVVLATCHSIFLADETANVTNVIATKTEVSGKEVAKWGRSFYRYLAQGDSLYKAYKLTDEKSPMKLFRWRDVAFAPRIQQA
ncbi:MAG TPA: TIR domain-containing protein [Thermoanaerobaculia bacterium]|jgi:hypothetical protein|nr:TIR domain-containing protein [Thermoanaerobaculia bacterium]